jgi:5'(3')-deoxyribonucleotidase
MVAGLSAKIEGFMAIIGNSVEGDSLIQVRDWRYEIFVIVCRATDQGVCGLKDKRNFFNEFWPYRSPFRCVSPSNTVVVRIALLWSMKFFFKDYYRGSSNPILIELTLALRAPG